MGLLLLSHHPLPQGRAVSRSIRVYHEISGRVIFLEAPCQEPSELLYPLHQGPVFVERWLAGEMPVDERRRVAAGEGVEGPARGRADGERRPPRQGPPEIPTDQFPAARFVPRGTCFEPERARRLHETQIGVLRQMLLPVD